MTFAKPTLWLLVCLIVGGAGGCTPSDPPTLSPTPEQDPQRYEQAKAADEKARRQNQEAERQLMKKRHSPLPVK